MLYPGARSAQMAVLATRALQFIALVVLTFVSMR